MRMKKKLVLSIMGLMLFASISGALGYQEYLYRWKDDGSGEDHLTGCHKNVSNSTANGTLVITLSYTGTLEPLEEFNVTLEIFNFTEAIEEPYNRRVTLGIPGYMEDNEQFSSSMDHQTLNRGERVDATYGSYSPSDDDNVFVLFAPANPGTYTLGAVAIAAVNQSNAGGYNQTYVEGTIEITVVSLDDVTDPIISADTDDFSVENDYTGETVSWTATDANPDTYTITHNGIVVVTATAWVSGTEVQYSIPDSLAEVNHVYTIEFTDDAGHSVRDTVVVTVGAAPAAPATIPGFQLLFVIVPLTFGLLVILLKRKVKTSEK